MAERVFSEVIRTVREARGLSQGELGARCTPPRSQEAVSQWEAGAHGLSERTMDVVAIALGTSTRELLLEGLGASATKKPS